MSDDCNYYSAPLKSAEYHMMRHWTNFWTACDPSAEKCSCMVITRAPTALIVVHTAAPTFHFHVVQHAAAALCIRMKLSNVALNTVDGPDVADLQGLGA